jgi:integrase
MAVYPKGNKFMASVGTGAERVRKTFNTESEALAWEKQEEAHKASLRAIPAPLVIVPTCWTIQESLDQVHKHVWKGTGGEAKAIANAKQAVAFFGPDTLTSEIHANWIIEYMEELQDEDSNCGATCNKKLSALSMLLKRAEEFGGLKSLPKMKRYKEGQHRIRWFSDAEESAMLKMSTHLGLHELHDFIVIGLDTGFRKGELLGLTLADYHKGMLMLHAGETKNGNSRSVPCSTRIKAILADRQAKGARTVFPTMSSSQLRKQWEDLRAILGKAEDPGFIIHVLRHTCATRLVSEGVPLPTVQTWMGHKVIQTTMRYAHMAHGQLQAAVELLEARKPDTIGT